MRLFTLPVVLITGVVSCGRDARENAEVGSVTGVAVYAGFPPASLQVNPSGSIPGVSIDIPSAKSEGPSVSVPAKVVVEAGGCWEPRIVMAAPGTKVTIGSKDEVRHVIKWFFVDPQTRVAGARRVSIDPGALREEVAPEVGTWVVECLQHQEERFHIICPPSKFWTFTDAQGRFKIDGLAPGSYLLSAWHPSVGQKLFKCEVRAGANTVVDVTF